MCIRDRYRGAAALAIGIGGTGVAALAELKQKVYPQLEPDDPDSPVPEYQHIQFLAIDSDTTDIDQMRGKAKLDRGQDFFSINNPNLAAALRAKDLIKGNASLNWMDIDPVSYTHLTNLTLAIFITLAVAVVVGVIVAGVTIWSVTHPLWKGELKVVNLDRSCAGKMCIRDSGYSILCRGG